MASAHQFTQRQTCSRPPPMTMNLESSKTQLICRNSQFTLYFDLSLVRCAFHEDLDLIHCSLRECNIACFVMSEALCPKFGVSFTVKHLPKGITPVGGHKSTQRSSMGLRPWMGGVPPSPAPPTSSSPPLRTHSLPNIGQLSLGRGRGRGAGNIRQPSTVGGLQSRAYK